jgi:hypothetical protein
MDTRLLSATARDTWRVLTFRASREELIALDSRHLVFGFVCTWLVGMGRHWDAPKAHLAQRLGIGSLVYVVVLALALYVVMLPLSPRDWSYRRLLTFITLVSPPAALYAIPVERFFPNEVARSMNAWFLGVVALWRVSLLFFFLARLARFRWYEIVIAGLLPLTAIVTALFLLNLEHVTFDLMGGIRDSSSNDRAYAILFILTLLSSQLFLPLLIAYVVLAIVKRMRRRNAEHGEQGP